MLSCTLQLMSLKVPLIANSVVSSFVDKCATQIESNPLRLLILCTRLLFSHLRQIPQYPAGLRLARCSATTNFEYHPHNTWSNDLNIRVEVMRSGRVVMVTTLHGFMRFGCFRSSLSVSLNMNLERWVFILSPDVRLS